MAGYSKEDLLASLGDFTMPEEESYGVEMSLEDLEKQCAQFSVPSMPEAAAPTRAGRRVRGGTADMSRCAEYSCVRMGSNHRWSV